MSEPEPAPQEARPLELANQVDRICDQFEAALRAGQPVSIEELLATLAAPSDRAELLRELVALDVDFRRAHGETISFLNYYRRFPEATPLLDELQREWNLRDSSGFIAVRAPVQLDGILETVAFVKPPPQKIRQFELLSVLGTGGFGTVWRAHDTLLQREVAVKVPRKDRVMGMNMSLFLREARAAAKLRHPNIVAIHEVGEEDSAAFIVSDLVDGVSLKAWLETTHISSTEAAMLVAKLAAAAHHAHERGIVHRDLKPANVLIDLRGEPHIADFGLAKRDAVEDSLAVGDQLVGTPAYMAPEQARGNHKAIDRRTDVYALGAILYELLTGQRHFSGELAMMLNQIQHVPPLAPRKIKSEIPRELEAICLKCLAKDSDQRYSTAQELADDLYRHIGGETLHGIPTPVPVRMQKWFYRHRRLVLPMLSIALVVSGLAVVLHAYFFPAVPSHLQQVEFTTIPPGCEITVVAIDPDTGEPDPTTIQHAIGLTQKAYDSRTQLTMTLAPGNYLVVAVLKENPSRFHEVLRHVPRIGEHPIPAGAGHQNWSIREAKGTGSAVVTAPVIRIPELDVITDMGLADPQDPLELPMIPTASQWHLPAFFVDLNETPLGDAQQSLFAKAVTFLERQGKRLPSAAELYYLGNVHCPPRQRVEDNDAAEPPCLLRGKPINGLHSGVWEWTTTRPGGLFSGLDHDNRLPDLAILRMLGCGAKPEVDLPNNAPSAAGFLWQSEHNVELPIGIRGVRSAKARCNPEDFLQPVAPAAVKNDEGKKTK